MQCAFHPFGLRNNSVSIETLSDHLNSDLCMVSPRGGYAVRERDRGRYGSTELYSERARVSLSPLLPCFHLAERGPIPRGFFSENRDKTETLLAFGASRFEACRPLAVEAIRLAMMPTINAMRYAGTVRTCACPLPLLIISSNAA